MDAHFFRRLACELRDTLTGARVERVYCPSPDTTTLVLHTRGPQQNLLLRADRRFPLLFLSPDRPENPASPTAHAMWLRKYTTGKRLGSVCADWAMRRMAFALVSPQEENASPFPWLVVDIRQGVTLLEALPAGFGVDPVWLEPGEYSALLASAEAAPGNTEVPVWQIYPQYTPLLRETLAVYQRVDPMEGLALLADVEAGPGACDNEVFAYVRQGASSTLSVWPLPQELRRGAEELQFSSALEAVEHVGQPALFGELTRERDKVGQAPDRAACKRVKKTLAKLDAEEHRLHGMIVGERDALALQSVLWRIGADARLDSVMVPSEDTPVIKKSEEGTAVPTGNASAAIPNFSADHAEGIEMAEGQSLPAMRLISLDRRYSVRENMERLFRQAARGKRGIGMLAARREELRGSLERLERGEGEQAGVPRRKPTAQKNASAALSPDAKLFQRFRSSDGFLLLRGRNAKGNHEILYRTQPHDFWFHAEDGPSAHLVLRREHPGQAVPERTLQEAAILVGLKSWQREGGQARVMCALVRHVRKVKGAALGAVHVERMERSLLVELEPDLEARLAV